MKKIIIYSLLLLNLLINCTYADNYNSDGTYNIGLSCINAPTYNVKIPKTINVTSENTILTFYVKADLYADQSLKVEFDDSTTLSCNNSSVPVYISQNKKIWSYEELSDSYLSSSIRISHTKLKAGVWSGRLNVYISLQGGQNT